MTCEVTPHHFALTDEDVGEYDTNFKMNPPLRSASDREAILAALADGTIDAIATDHAPHAPHEKIIEFERAAFGITGLETAVGLAITHLHREQKLSLSRIVELFTAGPARVFTLRGRGTLARGSYADVTIFDPKKRWTFEAAKSRSRSQNTPFDGSAADGESGGDDCGRKNRVPGELNFFYLHQTSCRQARSVRVRVHSRRVVNATDARRLPRAYVKIPPPVTNGARMHPTNPSTNPSEPRKPSLPSPSTATFEVREITHPVNAPTAKPMLAMMASTPISM